MSIPGGLSLVAFATPSLDYILATAALLLAAAAGIALTLMLRRLLRSYLRHRGTRIVTCPETTRHEAIRLDALHAAATGLFGPTHLSLESCTRWPERQDCPQECIKQIELSPNECRLRAMLMSWYGAQKCVYCHRPFEQVHWFDHKPGLLTPKGDIVEWKDVSPSSVPVVLATHRPVCWDCMIVESFRTKYPDLVVERGSKA